MLANSFCCKLDAEENVVAFVASVAEVMSDARDFECNNVKVLADSDIPWGFEGLEVSKYVEELLWGK